MISMEGLPSLHLWEQIVQCIADQKKEKKKSYHWDAFKKTQADMNKMQKENKRLSRLVSGKLKGADKKTTAPNQREPKPKKPFLGYHSKD